MQPASPFFFDPLPRHTFRTVVIDPPWKFSAGTKSRPQHYPRMKIEDIAALPVRELLHPDGARVMLYITAPLLNRIHYLARAWGLRYSSSIPWLKLWPSEGGMFVYRDSLARGHGFEVVGNAEYIAILKWRKPQSIKGRPFRACYITPRREHSRKPDELYDDIESRFDGPFADVFARQPRAGWAGFGNELNRFPQVAA
jgi:N6-adenosine-specific RNA methylase IME4